MAKKTTRGKSAENSSETQADRVDVSAAEEALRMARDQLRKAEQAYEDVRAKAAEKIEEVKEKSVGEVIDDGRELVRKYPGISVAAAALAGFFLGRLFSR